MFVCVVVGRERHMERGGESEREREGWMDGGEVSRLCASAQTDTSRYGR